jgi:hypothetical protein
VARGQGPQREAAQQCAGSSGWPPTAGVCLVVEVAHKTGAVDLVGDAVLTAEAAMACVARAGRLKGLGAGGGRGGCGAGGGGPCGCCAVLGAACWGLQRTGAAAEGRVVRAGEGPAAVLVVRAVWPCALPGGVHHGHADGVVQALEGWGCRVGMGAGGARRAAALGQLAQTERGGERLAWLAGCGWRACRNGVAKKGGGTPALRCSAERQRQAHGHAYETYSSSKLWGEPV